MMIKLTGICLITPDVLGLTDFYCQVLGATSEGDAAHAEIHTVGAGLAIFSTEGMDDMAPGSMQGAGAGNTTIMFQVADVDAEYERLKALGVTIIKPPQTHPWGSRSVWFRDPDGNIVDFCAQVTG